MFILQQTNPYELGYSQEPIWSPSPHGVFHTKCVLAVQQNSINSIYNVYNVETSCSCLHPAPQWTPLSDSAANVNSLVTTMTVITSNYSTASQLDCGDMTEIRSWQG